MVPAINENLTNFFILKPKHNRSRAPIEGSIWRLNGEKVIIEISQKSFDLVLQTHKNELYDIVFMLNRSPYQLQHHTLNRLNRKLFDTLIRNPGKNGPVENQSHSMPFLQ